MKHEILGLSPEKRPIEVFRLTQGRRKFLLLSGVHGDEPEGFGLVERFLKEGPWRELEGMAALWVLPRLNPDGCVKGTRTNSKGVDLNRNMPTQDWSSVAKEPRYFPGPSAGSESENKILIKFIEEHRFDGIITAHSWEPCINYNGPAKRWAEVMAEYNRLKITDYIGYSTPGSFGTWAGTERGIPTLTLEIQEGSDLNQVWNDHAEALMASLMFAALNESLE